MTFDVRSEGGGVIGVLRSGTQTIIAPLQKGAAFVVNPVVDMIDSLTNVATLREENQLLQQQVEDLQAQLVAVDDQLARLELYEQLYDLEATGTALGRTVAQVIGQPPLEGSLLIDKGTSDGVLVGQPVIDTSGYVVGSVDQATAGSATIVPITVGPSGLAVAVEDQTGTLMPQIDTNVMRLQLDMADDPVFAGDQVVTSSASVRFPSGYPVGRVLADAAPANDSLTTEVEPFVHPETLRVVVVLAWPPDPVTAITPKTTTTTSTTTTTVPGEGSTTTTVGEGGG